MSSIKTALSVVFLLISTICYAQTKEVSLEKKIAQMIILSFSGTEVSDSSEIVCDIREKGIGGVLLFESNIVPVENGVDSRESLRRLCERLQRASSTKLIISIDQEGGLVNRLKTKYGFVESVPAQYLGEINREDSSRYYYRRMAEQNQMLGFNVNFGPCIDLNINSQCPVIGSKHRSYGASVREVNRHARFFVEEHHRVGVKTSFKHFPGHGSSLADSHLGFTDITHTWKHKELRPYRYFFRKSLCDIVMVSHTFNSKLDPDYPASLSRRTIDSLLRKKMGYDGIVITDDMNMKAITANYSFEKAMMLTINAGVDLIIINEKKREKGGRSVQEVIDTIVSLVQRGLIPSERIDEAYRRILRFKE